MGYFHVFSFLMPNMNNTLPVDMKFEAALVALEQIVRDMESGEQTLEDSIAAYRQGTSLLKHCQQQLADAEHQLRGLENNALKDTAPKEAS